MAKSDSWQSLKIKCAGCDKPIAEIYSPELHVKRDAQITGLCQACGDIMTMPLYDEYGLLVKAGIVGLSEAEIKARCDEGKDKDPVEHEAS